MTIPDLIKNGLVPVFYGDLLPVLDGSYKVISSDFLTFLLSKALKPENVIFLTNVKGIFPDKEAMENNADQEIIKELTQDKMAKIRWSDNEDSDVSGGMRKKAELALEISDFCNSCFIGSGFTENVLSKIFNGESVEGTFVNRF
jgi:isopentenyl phosphate kinase